MRDTNCSVTAELLVGPPRAGKTEHLIADYLEGWGGQQAQNLWLCPTQHRVELLRQNFAQAAPTAILAPNIFTFAGFAERLIQQAGLRLRPLSALQKRHLLRAVITTASGRLAHFQSVAHTPGFLEMVQSRIVELKRQDLWPADFQQRIQSGRDRDLGVLYELYQQRLLQGNWYDAEGRFWAAREILKQQASNLPQNQAGDMPQSAQLAAGNGRGTCDTNFAYGRVVVDGFSDFTAPQHEILQLLAARAEKFQLALTLPTMEPDSVDPYAGRALLLRKPRSTCHKLQAEIPQLQVRAKSRAPQEFPVGQRLRELLFADEATRPPFTGTVEGLEIVAAASPQDEVAQIAARIKNLLVRGSARPDDVVVVCESLPRRALRLQNTCHDFGLPVYLESAPTCLTAPLVRLLLALLRLHLEDWPFPQLLRVVGNYKIRLFDRDGDPSTPRIALENCLRRAQIPSGRVALLAQLQRWTSTAAAAEEPRLPAHLRQAALAAETLTLLAEHLAALPARANLDSWVQAIEDLLIRLGVLGDPAAADEATAWSTWRSLRHGLQSLPALEQIASGTSSLDLAGMLATIEFVAQHQPLGGAPEWTGRIRVLSPESARHVSAPHVFFLGLGEQALLRPARLDADDPTLQLEQQSESMLLFYELVLRATASLTLSYTAVDEKGQPLLPSPLLTELQACLAPAQVPLMAPRLGFPPPETPYSLSDFRQQAVAAACAGEREGLAGMLTDSRYATVGNAILDGLICVAQRAQRDEFGPYEGIMVGPAAQAALQRQFDPQHLWSPSQLESYASCPFRFFAQHLLHLEPLPELTVASDAARRGSLLHQVLAALHRQLQQAVAHEETEQELLDRFLKTLQDQIDAHPLGGLEQQLREIERREIAAWAPRYIEQESAYRDQWGWLTEPPQPAFFEVRFGPEVQSATAPDDHSAATAQPFALNLGAEKILLVGQIDRLDVGRVGGVAVLNVIDYKSGRRELKLDPRKVQSGHQLQLPLYALAAEQHLLVTQQAQTLTTGYWNIRGQGFERHGKRSGFALREVVDQTLTVSDAWERLQPLVLQRLQQIVTSIRQGNFPVYNEDLQCTNTCPYRTLCRIGHIRSLEKTWETAP